MRLIKYLFIAIILVIAKIGISQGVVPVKPLFSSDSLLELQISMDVKTVISNRVQEERISHKAILSYTLADGDTIKHSIGVKVRGNNRANPKVCSFPPLKLDFKKNRVDSTLFAGQNKLKLVTHCNASAISEEFILREYYVYKLYQIISPYSLNVRLTKISYKDTVGKFKSNPHYSFLIEDIDDLAERMGMIEFEDKILNQEVCERNSLDKLMFFQFLIGNLDWSVPYKHNFKLIAVKGSRNPVAVPYDFDYAGIINKPDAVPPANMGIESVRERVFRGLCRVEGGYDDAVAYFQKKKPEIYALYRNSAYLSDKSKKYTLKYIDGFYKILDDPKLLKQKILHACWANHKHLYEY